MNAYNNITWESDRLEFEEGTSPYGNLLLAILGIPTEPRKSMCSLPQALSVDHNDPRIADLNSQILRVGMKSEAPNRKRTRYASCRGLQV